MARTLLLLLPLLATACTTTRETATPNADSALVQVLDPAGAWRVMQDGELRGYVVRFVDRVIPTRCSYSVRNELQQELGTIDELGRAWRFVPHQREAQWVCTATLSQGAARLLGLGAEGRLEEVSLDALRAPLPPR